MWWTKNIQQNCFSLTQANCGWCFGFRPFCDKFEHVCKIVLFPSSFTDMFSSHLMKPFAQNMVKILSTHLSNHGLCLLFQAGNGGVPVHSGENIMPPSPVTVSVTHLTVTHFQAMWLCAVHSCFLLLTHLTGVCVLSWKDYMNLCTVSLDTSTVVQGLPICWLWHKPEPALVAVFLATLQRLSVAWWYFLLFQLDPNDYFHIFYRLFSKL